MDNCHAGWEKQRQIAFIRATSSALANLRWATLGLIVALCLTLMSCSTYRPNYLSDRLQAVSAVENFYFHLDVDRYTIDSLDDIVSDDFLVFESGQTMDRAQFHTYLSHTDDYFKLKILKKNNDTFLKPGSLVCAKIVGVEKDKFEVEI